MKKNIVFLLVLSVILLSSCTTKKEVVIPNITVITDVHPSDWQYSASSQTYYVTLSMPEIDSYTNQYDGILVSMSGGSNIYEGLPEVYNGNSYSYTHQPGFLTVEVQGANGATVTPPTYTVRMKIVIIPSN